MYFGNQAYVIFDRVHFVHFFRQSRADSEHAKFILQKLNKKWLHIKTNWYYYLKNFYPIIRLWEVKYSNICHQMCAIFIICKEELSRCRFFSKCSHYIFVYVCTVFYFEQLFSDHLRKIWLHLSAGPVLKFLWCDFAQQK